MSATAAQLAANRANAQHSTGPATPEGKAASARNAVRHGFRSTTVVLPHEDPAEYDALLACLAANVRPQSLNGERCVREMADSEWRLRRARAHQHSLLVRKIEELAAASPDLPAEEIEIRAHEQLTAASPYFRQLLHWEEKFRRQYDRAWHMSTSEQTKRRKLSAYERLVEALPAIPPRPLSAPPPARPPSQIQTNEPNPSVGATPRNAPCPCGSRVKYKRCCGKSAPPLLFAA